MFNRIFKNQYHKSFCESQLSKKSHIRGVILHILRMTLNLNAHGPTFISNNLALKEKDVFAEVLPLLQSSFKAKVSKVKQVSVS